MGMPFADYADFDACVSANSDKSDPEAYCAAIKREVEGESALSDAEKQALAGSDCPDGKVKVNGECVKVTEVDDTPPSVLNSKAILAASLDTEPIERVEEGDNTRYKNLRLLTEGVWTDQKSKTPTLYSEDGIAEIEAQYDESKYRGPPVNVMHDVDPASGEVHEASHGGYVDPNSLTFQHGALMGDVVLDTTTSAGAFADENLQSALENNGRVGFGGPSVELDLDPEAHIQNSEHPRAEKEISGGYLTGLGLVMNPADKNIDFARETRERAVAMADSQTDKAVYAKQISMSDKKAIRNAILERELAAEDIEEEAKAIADEYDDVSPEDVMELLAPLMDMEEEEEEEEPPEEEPEEDVENEEGEDEDEEEENEEDAEMSVETLAGEINDLWSELESLKESMASSEELAEAREELAEAETVKELQDAKESLDERLETLEEEPERKTLADGASIESEEEEEPPVQMAHSFDEKSGTIRR